MSNPLRSGKVAGDTAWGLVGCVAIAVPARCLNFGSSGSAASTELRVWFTPVSLKFFRVFSASRFKVSRALAF